MGSSPALYGAIEAGGTKFVCAVGTHPDNLVAFAQFPTTTPADTVGEAIRFLAEIHTETPLAGVGIASFGPVDVNTGSPTYGSITTTPKVGWENTPLVEPIRARLGVPVGFDTDVNGAALGEHRWGAGRGLDTFVYLTVGTGIGGGALINGRLSHGLLHPEMGHMLVPHDWDADPYAGHCIYHGDCLEGLASGPAIEQRWGFPARELPAGHPSWHLQAHYLALAAVNIICTISPQRIILGGGVMKQAHLFPKIHEKVQTLLNGYIQRPEIVDTIEDYIVPPELGSRAGVLGALALAQDAAAAAQPSV
jgi:fructokinase